MEMDLLTAVAGGSPVAIVLYIVWKEMRDIKIEIHALTLALYAHIRQRIPKTISTTD